MTILQLLLIITALVIAVTLLAHTLWEVTREKHQKFTETLELHLANSRLQWEAEMLKAEPRTTCKLNGIPVPNCCKPGNSHV